MPGKKRTKKATRMMGGGSTKGTKKYPRMMKRGGSAKRGGRK